MKVIQLTQGMSTTVDDSDFDMVNQWKWYACGVGKAGQYFYAVRQMSRKEGLKSGRMMIYMHRVIMRAEIGQEVDHRSRNTLDNQKENLRVAVKFQNMANADLRVDNNSKFKGVSWHKKSNKWQAQIGCNGTRKHIGYFPDPVDAARAYDAAALIRFGEFAATNKMLNLLPA